MLKSLGTEFKVGLFAIVALVALGYMLFVLSPESFQDRDYYPYYTHLANAAGIVPKTQVKTAGVTIGKVKSVRLDDGKTRVDIDVYQDVKIPSGSKIEIRSVGLLGDKHLEIIRPVADSAPLQPGGYIQQSTDGNDIESLIGIVGEIAKDIKKVTTTMANVLGNEKGEKSIQSIIDNVEQLTADFKVTSGTLRKLVGEREDDYSSIVSDMRGSMNDLRETSRILRSIASTENKDRINSVISQFDQAMVDVRGSVRNINLIAEKVEKGEGTLGKLVNDDATLQDLQGALKDMRKILSPATRLAIDVDSHGEYRRDQSSQYWVNIIFRTRPDRYYLLGVSDRTYDTVDRREIEVAGEKPGETRYLKTERKQNALRFDLQIAKRWYWFVARAGLFQTTGGLAADAYFWNDRIRLTGEMFEINTLDKSIRRNAHFKTWASALFYNHIYTMIGFDDLSKTDPTTGKARKIAQSLFVGGGITFNDEDLRAIFGTIAILAR